MAHTRDFRLTMIERARREPAFARAMRHEAETLFVNGETDVARSILVAITNADSAKEKPRPKPGLI